MLHHLPWQFERFSSPDADPVYVDATISYRYEPGGYVDIDGSGRRDYPVGPEVEINDIVGADGKALAVTAEERAAVEEHIANHPPELGPDPDYARDCMIEDREMERFYGEDF